jgi:hypothetical protein
LGVIKIKKFFSKNVLADLLLVGSFFILFFTTLSLNKYIALYLLAIGMLGGSYLMMKGDK